MHYITGSYGLDTDRYALTCNDRQVEVEPQVFDLLIYLIENRERVVSRDELLAELWNGRVVSDSALTSSLKAARRAVGDDGVSQRVIKTIHGRGYQFVGDIEEIQSPVQGEPSPGSVSVNVVSDKPAIAVLPFENMSGDQEQEYFADGITADIIDTLSRFRHLRTVSRYSTRQYKTEKLTIPEIARQQQVRYVLEGGVRRSGTRIRVNAELIDSVDGRICWSERFDRELDDLFSVQDEITRSIAVATKAQLDDGEMARIRSRGSSSIRAWELTLSAIDLQDTYIRENVLEARSLAKEAVRLDPNYAYAWISLGWTHWQEIYSGWYASLEASIAEAEKALGKALAIEPDHGEAHSFSGSIHMMKHDSGAAIRDCLRAVALEPGNAEIQALTASAHVFAGDYDRGRQFLQGVHKLCPVRPNWYYLMEGHIEVANGNLERAAGIYRAGLEVEPESTLCRFFLVDVMERAGDRESAQRYADEIHALDNAASGRGIVHVYSANPELREAFRNRLQRFDLI